MTDIRKTEKTPVNMANNFERVKILMQVAMKCWRTAKSDRETTLQNVGIRYLKKGEGLNILWQELQNWKMLLVLHTPFNGKDSIQSRELFRNA